MNLEDKFHSSTHGQAYHIQCASVRGLYSKCYVWHWGYLQLCTSSICLCLPNSTWIWKINVILAHTAKLTIYSVLQSEGYTANVIFDNEDTYNYVQAVYVAQRTPGFQCVKYKHQLIIAQMRQWLIVQWGKWLHISYYYMFSLDVTITLASMEEARSPWQRTCGVIHALARAQYDYMFSLAVTITLASMEQARSSL